MTAVSHIKITNRQSIIVSTVGSVMVRAAGLEPARRMAMEPKSIESTNSTTPAYSNQYSTPAAVTQAKIPAAAEKSPPAAKKVSYFPETVIQYKAKNTGILRDA